MNNITFKDSKASNGNSVFLELMYRFEINSGVFSNQNPMGDQSKFTIMTNYVGDIIFNNTVI